MKMNVKHSKLFCAVIVALVAVILMASVVYSSSVNSTIVIHNFGTINIEVGEGITVAASSGSSQDIQTAVDYIASHGGIGTVTVPSGNWTFNIPSNHIGASNYPCGVLIPSGISVQGAANNATILFCGLDNWQSSTGGANETTTYYEPSMFNVYIKYSNATLAALPSRISNIVFQGSVNMSQGANDQYHSLTAVLIQGVKNYRVDHCTFRDFTNAAIMSVVYFGSTYHGNCGLVDHCDIDNPYKNTFLTLTGNQPLWAYGIIAGGDENYGTFEDYTTRLGKYAKGTMIIEDCVMARCRHMVAGAMQSNSFYVLRHCIMTDIILAGYGAYQDVHGGALGCEVYNCTIINTMTDYRTTTNQGYWGTYAGIGLYSRGGFALYYNNTLDTYDSIFPAIELTNDQTNVDYKLHNVWIWSNTFTNTTEQWQLGINWNNPTIQVVPNVDYFLRAPTSGELNYTALPYPFPLDAYGQVDYPIS